MRPLPIEKEKEKKFCISYGHIIERFKKKKIDGHLHCSLVESRF
jgi:hypothetical protein